MPVGVQCIWNARIGQQIAETGLTDGCGLFCGCEEQKPGPVKEQPVLITLEPFLQSPGHGTIILSLWLWLSVSMSPLFPIFSLEQ